MRFLLPLSNLNGVNHVPHSGGTVGQYIVRFVHENLEHKNSIKNVFGTIYTLLPFT